MTACLALLLALQAGDDDVLRWAAQLAKPETRARAADRLAHAAPAALRRLPDLDPALLKAAEENAALSHSYGPPRLFSLDGREEELDELLVRLERGAGFIFQRSSLTRGMKVALRLDGASAWETLVEAGRACSFNILGVEGPQIYLSPAVPPARPRCYSGPLLVEVERLSRRSHVGFDATTRDFWLRLAVWWEPHVVPAEAPSEAVATRVVDDQGRVLGPRERPARRADPFPRTGHASLLLDGFEPPGEDAAWLAVEGYFELRFPARVARTAFEGPGRADLDGLRAELKLSELAVGGIAADVVLTFDDPSRAAAYRATVGDLVFESDVPTPGLRPTLGAVAVDGARVSYTVRTPAVRRLADLRRVRLRVPEGSVVKRVPFRFDRVELK